MGLQGKIIKWVHLILRLASRSVNSVVVTPSLALLEILNNAQTTIADQKIQQKVCVELYIILGLQI